MARLVYYYQRGRRNSYRARLLHPHDGKMTDGLGVELKVMVPCAEGKRHQVRLRFTGWGEYEVVYNPCEELLGVVFARMAGCSRYIREEFSKRFWRDRRLKLRLVEALQAAGAPAVPMLLQALGDSCEKVRAAACRALGKIGDSQAVPALSVWAHAGNQVALEALRALRQPALALDEAALQLATQGRWDVLIRVSADATVREEVAKLGTLVVPVFVQALRDARAETREEACRMLGNIGDPQAVPALVQALDDEDCNVREAACWALGEIGDSEAAPALVRMLGDSWEYASWAASDALTKMGDRAVPALIQALESSNPSIRAGACAVLGQIGNPQVVPALVKMLRDSDSAVRFVACRALGEIGDSRAVPELIQMFTDIHYSVSKAACEALVRIGTPAVPALIEALHSDDHSVRVEACEALGRIGDLQALPALIQALGDSTKWVRAVACEALSRVDDPQVVPALIQALEDSEADVRQAACVALGVIGDPAAIPYLRRVASRDRACAYKARKAIKQIRAQQAEKEQQAQP